MKIFIAALLVAVVLVSGCVQQPAAGKNVEVTTADNVVIRGTFYAPFEGRPVVILAHQNSADRSQWNSFIPLLLERNYSVLAYDLRGMGQSTTMANGSDFVKTDTYYEDMPRDVKGVIDFLAKQDNIDKTKIGIIGTSIGGNVAYVSAGAYPQIKVAVSISPSTARMTGTGILNFYPKRIFFLSDAVEAGDANLLYLNSQDPKMISQYKGAGHGIQILSNDAAAADIFDWLKKFLG